MYKYGWLVLLGAISFGVLSSFVKLSLGAGYTVGEVTGVQVFFGMLMLWLFFLVGRATRGVNRHSSPEKNRNGRSKREAPWKVILAGMSTGMVSITYYQCIALLPASVAIVLLMQFVWIGVFLEYVLFKTKPSAIQMVGVVLVMGGTLFAAGLFNEVQILLSVRGVIYGLLAATSYAIFLMVMSRVGNAYNPVRKSALMLTGACALIFIVFPPLFLINGVLISGLWKWGLILASLGTVIPPLFFAVGTPKIGAGLSSIISAIELPVAVAMSFFVLQETVSAAQWAGVLIILAAIVVSNRRTRTGHPKDRSLFPTKN